MTASVAGLTTGCHHDSHDDGASLGKRSGSAASTSASNSVAIAARLGVPLHADHEAVTGQLDRFDDTVLAPGGDHQSASQPVRGPDGGCT